MHGWLGGFFGIEKHVIENADSKEANPLSDEREIVKDESCE